MATSIPIVSDNDVVRTSWGNTVRSEISALDGAAVKKTGAQSMAGPLTVTGATTLTGLVTIDPVSGDTCLRLNSAAPQFEFRNDAGTTRYAYVQGSTTGASIGADVGELRFVAGGAPQMVVDTNNVLFGKTVSDSANNGVELYAGASPNAGRVTSTISSDAAYSNYAARHMGVMDANGKFYAIWQHGPSALTSGTISQISSGCSYNETSDYRLKDDLGEIADPLGRLMELQPKHLRWKADGMEFDGFIAHEVDAVVPYAVSGTKDAVLPENDPFNPGAMDPQQLDTGKLIPLLTAALQAAVDKIETLEDRIATLEGGGVMALPVNVDTCTVHGTIVNLDGTPAVGTVEFAPYPSRLADASADTTIVSFPSIKATLDAAGSFEVALPATDDLDLNPHGWTYRVSVRTKHLPYYFNMDAPAGGDVDITDVTPIVASLGDAVIVGPPGPAMTLVEDPPGTDLYDLRMA